MWNKLPDALLISQGVRSTNVASEVNLPVPNSMSPDFLQHCVQGSIFHLVFGCS